MSQTIRRALLEKLVALPEWRVFREDFAVATGLQVDLVEDVSGCECLGRETRLCRSMAASPAGRATCSRFHQRLLVPRAEGASVLSCDAGLVETALPLRVSGFPLGFLVVAGFRLSDSTELPVATVARSRHLLAKAGVEFAAEELTEALAAAPVWTPRVWAAFVHWMELAVREILSRLTDQAVSSPAHLPWAVDKATRYIRARALQEPVSLPETARACGVSAGHLSRLFVRSTGLSFNAFVARFRAETAAAQLRQSRQSVTEIAFACGFNSLSQFHRIFSKIFGCSPGQWRQQADFASSSISPISS